MLKKQVREGDWDANQPEINDNNVPAYNNVVFTTAKLIENGHLWIGTKIAIYINGKEHFPNPPMHRLGREFCSAGGKQALKMQI
jgi:hypothetical protein